MANDTVDRGILEFARGVALLTGRQCVVGEQWEAGLVMQKSHEIGIAPTIRRVTSGTPDIELPLMNVCMTGNAICSDSRKQKIGMTLSTGHGGVPANKWELGFIVLKGDIQRGNFPGRCDMTFVTGGGFRSVWRRTT